MAGMIIGQEIFVVKLLHETCTYVHNNWYNFEFLHVEKGTVVAASFFHYASRPPETTCVSKDNAIFLLMV